MLLRNGLMGAFLCLSFMAQAQNKIINGIEVPEGDLIEQHVVSIRDESRRTICSGSVIGRDLILTAAHCVFSVPSLRVYWGPSQAEAVKKGNVRTVSKARIHESYVEGGSYDTNDLAVLKLSSPLPSSRKIANPVYDGSRIKESAYIEVAGYGINRSGINNGGSGVLRRMTLMIEKEFFSRSEFQLKQSSAGGTCSGDSGGPALLRTTAGGMNVYGVAARADGARNPWETKCKVYSFYTRLDYHKTWIQNAIRALR